ncbi:pyridine nucleotide-disulfide oxidoreductase [Agromyces badenianii]|uniref:Pyridine nucleotide-disulfide oxidoreductase n=1 Tax=Agromyces badenianii TaxID=2080742 RepID=A0A2S0WYQ2_9MICO|nr:NAD(P)-binding domain-containing protein [Agromyces badenianii]AWB96487.1 pyridine nucleotide-disulfide oxidoreductase [Agromyces badenianii]PWC05348.1 pyridine nucleotide-disulfide oxidoreductase [Agromyces badenianii]
MTSPERVKVVVIGAGQAGLSVAFYLRRFELVADEDFVMLDRAPGPGGAWQHRWSSLRLGTAHRVNDLPGMAELGLSFDTADRNLPAKEVVADYYDRFERHFDLRVRRPMNVRRVSNDGVDLLVRYEDLAPQPLEEQKAARGLFGRRRKTFEEPAAPSVPQHEISAQFLVNATGTWGSPFVPYYPGMAEFAGRHVHTSDYTDAEDFRDKHVVVVGGGTSAIGFMLELEEVAAGLTWVSRRPIDWLDRQELDLEGASAAVATQDEAARSGRALPSIVSGTGVPRSRRIAAGIERGLLVARPMFDRIEGDRVVWDGDESGMARADVIIWATGFRPDLRHLAPLKLREKTGGITVGQGAAWNDPRIFLAGYGPQASTIGANRAGRMIARQIMAML